MESTWPTIQMDCTCRALFMDWPLCVWVLLEPFYHESREKCNSPMYHLEISSVGSTHHEGKTVRHQTFPSGSSGTQISHYHSSLQSELKHWFWIFIQEAPCKLCDIKIWGLMIIRDRLRSVLLIKKSYFHVVFMQVRIYWEWSSLMRSWHHSAFVLAHLYHNLW